MILKKLTQKYRILFASTVFLCFLSSCTRDKVEIIASTCTDTITYDQHVQLILDNNCNLAGCHNSNSSYGDYTTFNKMSKIFDGNSLYTRVVNLKNMPPVNVLSEDDIQLFNCWIEGAYLEK